MLVSNSVPGILNVKSMNSSLVIRTSPRHHTLPQHHSIPHHSATSTLAKHHSGIHQMISCLTTFIEVTSTQRNLNDTGFYHHSRLDMIGIASARSRLIIEWNSCS